MDRLFTFEDIKGREQLQRIADRIEAQLERRKNENIEEWADKLSKDLSKLND